MDQDGLHNLTGGCWNEAEILSHGWEPAAMQVLLFVCYAVIAVYIVGVARASMRSGDRACLQRLMSLRDIVAVARAVVGGCNPLHPCA